MHKNRNVFLVLFLFLAACTLQPASNLEGDDWVVFSAETAKKYQTLSWLFSGEPEYWSPTIADVRTLEKGLPAYLQDNQSAFYMTQTLVWERLNEYNRQYVGVVLDGKKVIYGNYLCKDAEITGWKEQLIYVADGGACFFQFKFEPSTGRFFDLMVNGNA